MRFTSCHSLARIFAPAAALLLLATAAAPGQEPAKCFLWKVTSKTATVYILGTMHLGHESLYPLPKEIEDAFAASKSFAVEINPEKIDKAKLGELVVQKVEYPKGETLSKSLSKKTLDLLTKFCTENKLKLDQLDRSRPWGVSMALAGLLELPPDDWTPELGMDSYFLKKAAAEKKPVLELETFEATLWSASLSAELQDFLLFKALKDHEDKHPFPWEEMGRAWKRGDLKAAEDIIVNNEVKRHPQYKGVLEKMLDERSIKMVEKIEGYLKGNDTVFIAVGAGHLVGPKGILRLLEEKKYQVAQVARAADKKSK